MPFKSVITYYFALAITPVGFDFLVGKVVVSPVSDYLLLPIGYSVNRQGWEG
tara:strand:- start:173 stop:328 length:156 start_codon:yes stop_codon:yes gene_type:complete